MNENLTKIRTDLSFPGEGSNPTPPKVSVIVPVYKVEKYLPECIESILAQTFTDFELILVDDGSPDNSGKICDDYAARDSRIRVFHKENGGVSSARNLGLDNARGEWIAFVDSDDWVVSTMLSILYNYTSLEVDLVFCGFCSSTHKLNSTLRRVGEKTDAKTCLQELLSGCGCGGGPCCKLYRTKVSEGIRFNENISIFEDLLFVVEFLKRARWVINSNQSLYCYRMHASSAMHMVSEKTSWDRINGINLLSDLLRGDQWAEPLVDLAKGRVKFAVIRSLSLPREKLLDVWSNISPKGLPILKRIVLCIYPTPIWWVLLPIIKMYNSFEKLRSF